MKKINYSPIYLYKNLNIYNIKILLFLYKKYSIGIYIKAILLFRLVLSIIRVHNACAYI